MRRFILALVPAVLAACASERGALDRIDERLARIEERLGAMEERAAATPAPVWYPSAWSPSVWIPSVWPLPHPTEIRVPTVFPWTDHPIVTEGGCVLPGSGRPAPPQPRIQIEWRGLPATDVPPAPSAPPAGGESPPPAPDEPERR